MKTILKLFFLFTIHFWLLPTISFSQCDPQPFLDSCKIHIQNDHFHYLKEFTIDNSGGEKDKIEYSFVLSEGYDYEYYFTGFKNI